MARMLGRMRGSHCPACHGEPAGPDCVDKGKATRTAKRIEARQTRVEFDHARAQVRRQP